MNNSILIFGAMDAETEFLISQLSNVQKTETGGYPFFDVNFGNKKINTNEEKTVWGSGTFKMVMEKRGLNINEWKLIGYEYID